MIEKSSDLPAKKFRNQKREGHPSPDLRRVLHELMNQLTIMNFSCSKFRAAAAHLTDHSIAIDIDNMEKTIVDMTALVESVSQAMKSTSSQSPCADLLNAKPGRPPDRQIFIRFLNPIAALADRKSPGAISD